MTTHTYAVNPTHTPTIYTLTRRELGKMSIAEIKQFQSTLGIYFDTPHLDQARHANQMCNDTLDARYNYGF